MLTRNTTRHDTTQHVTRIKGRHADAAGAPEGPTRKVEAEQGQRGDGNAEGRQGWERQGAGGQVGAMGVGERASARRQSRKWSGACSAGRREQVSGWDAKTVDR